MIFGTRGVLCLLIRPLVREGLWLLLFHLPGTFLPMLVIPGECFGQIPMTLTLEGQYIVKNIILASAALVIAARYAHPAPKQQESGVRRMASGKRRSVASRRGLWAKAT
jgi:hypothetical protein